jgi:hypothetical protein
MRLQYNGEEGTLSLGNRGPRNRGTFPALTCTKFLAPVIPVLLVEAQYDISTRMSHAHMTFVRRLFQHALRKP